MALKAFYELIHENKKNLFFDFMMEKTDDK